MESVAAQRTNGCFCRQQPTHGTHRTKKVLSDLLPIVSLLSLTLSVSSSAYASRHDTPALAFVLLGYVDLLSLFFCLKRFEKLGPDSSSERRLKLKIAIWALVTALSLAFAWRVALVMPEALALVVWSLAAAVAMGGLYGLFVYDQGDDGDHGAVAHSYTAPQACDYNDEPAKVFSEAPIVTNV